ncbi:MAG TPA: SNF2-related protein, partial [Jiangellaceae bacterium]|nr:SNF2-related protein [Jiangellaceae bacterium]
MTILRFDPADPPRSGILRHTSPPSSTTQTPDRTSIADALPELLRHSPEPGSTAAYVHSLCRHALRMLEGGRLLPTVTDEGFDAWRVGHISSSDRETLTALAAAHPQAAAAVPAIELLDAVADVVARTPEAERLAGTPVFTSLTVHQVPELRTWASQIALERALSADDVVLGLRLAITDDDAARTTLSTLLHPTEQPGITVGVATLWQAPDSRGLRTASMRALRSAAAAWSPVRHLLTQSVPDHMELADDDVEHLLRQGIHDLAAAGVTVHGPRSLLRGVRAQAVLRSQPDTCTPGATREPHDELTLSWQLDLDGLALSRAEVDRLATAHRPLVRMDDRWVFVDREAARAVREDPTEHVSGIQALEAALTGQFDNGRLRAEVAPTEWVQTIKARLAEAHDPSTSPHAQPEGLTATLRHYQRRGLQWLAAMTSLGLGCCLADDMGLGKTITVIALHLHRRQNARERAGSPPGPTLVVCPASVLGTWEREIGRFAPGTPVHRYHGPTRTLESAADVPETVDAQFVLTTYTTMRTDAPTLAAHPWGMVIADEVQHAKNPSSSTAQALRTIPAPAKVALSGTPVENNL